jgi:hypothetical protein
MSFEVQKGDLKMRSLLRSLEKTPCFLGSSGPQGHQGLFSYPPHVRARARP